MKELLQKILNYEEYNLIPTVPFNRDVELRIKKAMSKFKILIPEHLVVQIGILTKDSIYHGIKYKKDSEFVIDSNTRKYFWKNDLSDKIPETLYATYHYYDSMDNMYAGYQTFDSVTSAESTSEKMTGIAILLGLDFKSPKIQKGTYVTALNYAAHALYPELFPDVSSKAGLSIEKMQLFRDELILLDEMNLGQKFNQAVISALLMSLKCHKVNGTEEKIVDFIDKFQEGYSDCRTKDKCGVTHVVEEVHKGNPGLFAWGTKRKEMPPQISFVLQNIDHYVTDTKTSRYTPKPFKNGTKDDYYSNYRDKHGFVFMSKFQEAA